MESCPRGRRCDTRNVFSSDWLSCKNCYSTAWVMVSQWKTSWLRIKFDDRNRSWLCDYSYRPGERLVCRFPETCHADSAQANQKNPSAVGKLIPYRIIAPGRHAVLMTYGGYDILLFGGKFGLSLHLQRKSIWWDFILEIRWLLWLPDTIMSKSRSTEKLSRSGKVIFIENANSVIFLFEL